MVGHEPPGAPGWWFTEPPHRRPEISDVCDGAVRLYSYGGRATYVAPVVASTTSADLPTEDASQDTGTASTPLFDALYAEWYGRR